MTRLEAIVDEIEEDMSNGDYNSALLKANELHYSGRGGKELIEQWDAKREGMIQVIENAIQNQD